MKVDVKVVARATSVLADEAIGVSLVDGLLNVGRLLVELATDVNVRWLSANPTKKHSPAVAFIARPATRQPSTSL